jgi:hypothetical protein
MFAIECEVALRKSRDDSTRDIICCDKEKPDGRSFDEALEMLRRKISGVQTFERQIDRDRATSCARLWSEGGSIPRSIVGQFRVRLNTAPRASFSIPDTRCGWEKDRLLSCHGVPVFIVNGSVARCRTRNPEKERKEKEQGAKACHCILQHGQASSSSIE